ncbi:C40 family peptidase [Thermoflavimicrobium dichotomicum]|uniref:Cell wall-associated hydrolase, NlpC family n=1 Tax=Thermoflavimicrobium dichotomicum TaxID=46223 RepID=A0A1I3QCY5_9BACL|nr:C40 family peptidase [Thermoflavimicrobium dichotomicum]SFJ31201.1 Cell wall-associated hydrolase, NlpC family [Thermoflavimicrobium dichotomicum]
MKKKGITVLTAFLVTALLSTGVVSATPNTDQSVQTPSVQTATVSTRTQKSDKLIAEAKRHLGKPYRYGSTGPSSFDCSGFTQYVFKQALGINLPRTASYQAKEGKSTGKSLSNLLRGDLMIFKEDGRVFHVAIYIGNGEMIHATTSKGVKIDKVTNTYWKPRFSEGRRIY